jgi:hypothetical protein
MTNFPDIPLDVRSELLLNGTWTDVSPYQDHGPVSIGRGHPDESTTVSPSTKAITWTNNDARFSSKNPVGPYYPWLVRNTQCRVSIPAQANYLRMEALQARAYVNDTTALHITGSIELRLQLQLTDWQGCILAARWDTGASWIWSLNPDGTLTFTWEDSIPVQHGVVSSVPLPLFRGQQALRVVLNAASGTVTFSTAATIDGTYTQLGAAQSGTGGAATSIQASNSPFVIGYSFTVSPGEQLCGRVYEARMYNGIAGSGGTVAADAIFSAQSAGTTTWTDSPGRTWLLGAAAEISSRDYRLHTEVPEWPQHQDPTGKTWTVSAAGGGLLRRLSQRNNAINSVMWRAWVKTGTALASYHPLEDGAGAQSLASGIGGPAAAFSGALELASNSDFLCSAPLPVLNGTVIVGRVPAYSGTWNGNQVSWLMEIPAGGEFNTAEVIRVATAGTVAQVVVTYGTGGSRTPSFYNAAGTLLAGGGAVTFAANGQLFLMVISLVPDGSGGVNWALEAATPGGSTFAGTTGNIASASVGAVTSWTLDGGGQLLQTVAGHVAVQAAGSIWDVTAFGAALNAHQGEAPGRRFQRLCSEEGIEFRSGGNLDDTPLMGAQAQQTLTQSLQECADAGRAIWSELRQVLGWGYTPRSALYNQAAAVAVTYAQDMLGEWASDPTEDDQVIRNDETVTQATGGGMARQFAAPGQAINGGRLSTASPSSGAGTYDGSDSLNVYNASDLPSLAAWIVHVGTVDEPRYPGVVLDLSNRGLASLFYAILGLELGQRLTIASPPAQLGPDTISLLAAQLSEELWGDALVITMAGVPSRPYLVAQEGALTGRADSDASTLHAGITSGATSMQVDTAAGSPLWDTTASGFDIGVAGERMTVTAISGSSSPQAFTVTRSVNGVVKAQSSGAPVALWNTPVAAL